MLFAYTWIIMPLVSTPPRPGDEQFARIASALDAQPAHGAWAPGRVNLIGEHIDYNGGPVLPIAIEGACRFVCTEPTPGAPIRVHALDVDQRADLCRGKRPPPGTWMSYLAGVLHGFVDTTGTDIGFDVAFSSTVPRGGGLSSSAALEVGFCTLLEQASGCGLDPMDKALLCQRAERDFAGVPCGIMDQAISTLACAGHAMLLRCDTLGHTHVPASFGGDVSLLVIDSGVKHALGASEYARRRATCDRVAERLGLEYLSRMDESALAELTGEELHCARHVVTETARTHAAAEALHAGDWETLGRLFDESHDSLAGDYHVSCRELDLLVDAAREHEATLGARMTGGGFGGNMIVLCRTPGVFQLETHVTKRYESEFGRPPTFRVVNAQGGCAGFDWGDHP